MKDHIYFKRYAFDTINIHEEPGNNLGLIVVIPAFNEPEIEKTLHSLLSCEMPDCDVEIILVINYGAHVSADIKNQSQEQYKNYQVWSRKFSSQHLKFHIIFSPDIHPKKAGPGYARKVGMDEAARRFALINNQNGIIASLDADCVVDTNYLKAIHEHWLQHPETNGVSIKYQHQTEGDFNQNVYDGIVNYELHLRYYVNAQRFSGFPYAVQTVGSSFAVSVTAYMKQGGMNKRKAGEDFYFIHKITPLGNYDELNTTTVYPSPRPSSRVPFGTGRSILEYLGQPHNEFTTYNFQTFLDLKKFLSGKDALYKTDEDQYNSFVKSMPESVAAFLSSDNSIADIQKINNNTQSIDTFRKAFYRWFDAFKLMKFVHFTRDHFYPNQPVLQSARALINTIDPMNIDQWTSYKMLEYYRKIDANRSADIK